MERRRLARRRLGNVVGSLGGQWGVGERAVLWAHTVGEGSLASPSHIPDAQKPRMLDG